MRFLNLSLFFAVFTCLALSLSAQDQDTVYKVLAVEHVRKFERAIYAPGQFIRFQMNDGKARYQGIISEVTDSSFFIVKSITLENLRDASQRVQRDEILFRFIRTIYVQPNVRGKGWQHFRDVIGGGLIGGGGMFSIILPVDAWLAGQSPNPTNMKISLGMLASGLLIKLLPQKLRYKIGKGYKLRVM